METRTFDVVLTVRVDAQSQGQAISELESRLAHKDGPIRDPFSVRVIATETKRTKKGEA